MLMVPEKIFVDAVKQVVKANETLVSLYGTGATLYLHSLLIGAGENIGVHLALEYLFIVFYTPVGAYFRGGLKPMDFIVSDYDRIASKGIGAVKVGGNYAAGLLPRTETKELDYSDRVYLDSAIHMKIEEVGAANSSGIAKDGKFITP